MVTSTAGSSKRRRGVGSPPPRRRNITEGTKEGIMCLIGSIQEPEVQWMWQPCLTARECLNALPVLWEGEHSLVLARLPMAGLSELLSRSTAVGSVITSETPNR